MWFVLALAGAVLTAAADVLTKRAASNMPEYAVALARWFYSLPVLALLIPFIKIPELSSTFWITLAILIPMEIAALLLYVKALHVSPISLSAPFLSFTPLLLLVTSWFILGESIPDRGKFGVALAAIGAYCMNLRDVRHGWLAPIKAILLERGPVMVLAVALIYAVTSALAKKAVVEAGPRFFAVLYLSVLTISFSGILFSARKPVGALFSAWKILLPMGLMLGAASIVLYTAMEMAPVTYVIAVKRLSLLITVIAGRLFLGEGEFGQRLLGASLMLGGVAIVAILG